MGFSCSDEACPHAWDEAVMVSPTHGAVIHRDECAYCCSTCLRGDGVYVCMGCHTGVCAEHIAKHLSLKPTHVMFTRIKELPPKPKSEDEEVKDVNLLGVVEAKEYETAVCCAACQTEFSAVPELAVSSYLAIKNAPVPGALAEENAFAGPLQKPQCPHLVCLEQLPNPHAATPTSDDKCSYEGCDCRVNNWMCVTCGAIGCPRVEAGGQGHALQHFLSTGHPAAVKLGTVTAQGADYYCYACDDDVADVHFAEHMAHFGIDVNTAKKTAKTMGELAYDYSSQFDFKKITESGADLVPAHGPGRTGIYNIGNSCYIASVVQCLFRLQPFQDAFYGGSQCLHQSACGADPYQCRACQTERIASGLLSGDFSTPDHTNEKENGIYPRLFKDVYAQHHPDFSTAAQQDAPEYLQYLLQEMQRHVKPASSGAARHPADVFDMIREQRTQCNKCLRVRYSQEKDSCLSLTIPMDATASTAPRPPADGAVVSDAEIDAQRPRFTLANCLDAYVAPTELECRCDACGEQVVYTMTSCPSTFPDVLTVVIRRAYFDVETLSTRKLDAYVDVPETVDLNAYRASGLQPNETEMPKQDERATSVGNSASGGDQSPVDEMALVTVVSMGVDESVARYALQQTNMNVERAIDYIFSHPNIEQAARDGGEAPATESASSPTEAPTVATDGSGTYELVGMISHMGASAKTGHYVSHIKDAQTGQWLLFNDEKVGVSQSPPFSMATLYMFQRK